MTICRNGRDDEYYRRGEIFNKLYIQYFDFMMTQKKSLFLFENAKILTLHKISSMISVEKKLFEFIFMVIENADELNSDELKSDELNSDD